MVTIHSDVVQGSPDWFALRAGVPTASDFDSLVTPAKWQPSASIKPYAIRKAAEAWTGEMDEQFSTGRTEQGQIHEKDARAWLAMMLEVDVREVGFVTNDRIGCSPDGLIGEHAGVEIKCPSQAVHTKYLLAGVLPPEYSPQVYGSMLVTGRPVWYFLSYRPKMPALLLKVEQDASKAAALTSALAVFHTEFDAAFAAIQAREDQPVTL